MNNPGQVFTRQDLMDKFPPHDVDLFLDLLEQHSHDEYQVMTLLDERVLVFEANAWDEIVAFMRSMGYDIAD